MCAVSNVGDRYRDRFQGYPWVQPWQVNRQFKPYVPDESFNFQFIPPPVSREEFDQLKADVAEMKEMLREAKRQDDENGEPMCEMEEKMRILRAFASMVGVSLDDVIAPQVGQVKNGD